MLLLQIRQRGDIYYSFSRNEIGIGYDLKQHCNEFIYLFMKAESITIIFLNTTAISFVLNGEMLKRKELTE